MAEAMLIVDTAIKPGYVEQFRTAAQALFERAQDEPDTLRYDYFISDDGLRNIHVEVFKDAAAFVYHNRNCADLVPALFENAEILRIDVIGDTSDELFSELAGNKLKHFEKLGGVTR